MIVKSLVLCILTILVSFESQGGNFLYTYSAPGIEPKYFSGKINSSHFPAQTNPENINYSYLYSKYTTTYEQDYQNYNLPFREQKGKSGFVSDHYKLTMNIQNEYIHSNLSTANIPILNGTLSGTISGSATICSGQNTDLLLDVEGSGLISGTLSDGTLFSGYAPTIIVTVSPDVTTIYAIASLSDDSGQANPADLTGLALVEVEPERLVSISIEALSNPVCPGSQVILIATAVNEGTYPFYQWKVNGLPAGGNIPSYTYTPAEGDEVSCVLTSNNAVCSIGSPATSNTVTIGVNPQLQAFVAIASDQNNICSGATVNFTAVPGNGGISPIFQWKVNNINTGINSPYFSYQPDNGDEVTCVLTSDMVCATGNPSVSNSLVMSVSPILPVSASISASQTTSCQGTTVIFSAAAINCGSIPQYQWKVNCLNAGTNSAIFAYIPLDGDIIVCCITSDALCVSGSPAVSNSIEMTVIPFQTVNILISESDNNICQGSIVTFNSTTVNEGTTPVFQWSVNGAISGSNSPSYTYEPNEGDLVSCTVTSDYQCTLGNPAMSNVISMSVNPMLPVGISVSEDQNAVCTGTIVTYTASTVSAGITPHYQWKVNGANAGTNSSTFSFIPLNGNIVSCELTSDLSCVNNNPAISNMVFMDVFPIVPLGVQVNADQNNICEGVTVNFTAITENAGSSPSYQWRVNGLNAGTNASIFTYNPTDGDIVTCIVTSSDSCIQGNPATANSLIMSVSESYPAALTINTSADTVCQGSVVNFTAIPIFGGPTPVYQWQVNETNNGTDQNTFSYTPENGDVISCILYSSLSCATGSPSNSNKLSIAVLPYDVPTVSIAASANPVCAGLSVLFTASTTNGGTNPTFQWKRNGINVGTNSSTFTCVPVNGESISCSLISDALCMLCDTVISNCMEMIVTTPVPVMISISADQNDICQGTTVNYVATPVNGGVLPSYQWKVNGIDSGTNSFLFSYIPVDGDLVSCVLSSDIACVTGNPSISNLITMSVHNSLPVSISIFENTNSTCQGSIVNFSSIVVNGGTAPVFQWMVNGINTGINSADYSYIPVDGDLVECRVTSNLSCANGVQATSNPVVMVVNAILPASISISADQTTVCEGDTVHFFAAVLNEGLSPDYQWTVNGTAKGLNSPFFSYAPANNDIVNCTLTSSLPCATNNPATSNIVALTVNPTYLVSVSISANQVIVCQGTTVTYTAIAINGGTNPIYQWSVNGVNTGTNASSFSYIPLNGDIIACELTSDLICTIFNPAISNIITMSVSNVLPVSVTITQNPTTACTGVPVTYTAAGVNRGSSPVYQWFVNGSATGTNSANYTYIPVNGDHVSCILTSSAICATGNPATSNTLIVNVNSLSAVSISITANQNNVCSGTAVSFNALTVNCGTAPVYQWKLNGTNTGSNLATFAYIPGNGDKISCTLTSNIACPTGNPAISNEIAITVHPQLPASIIISADQNNICTGTNVNYTLTSVNGGNNPIYKWKVNGVNTGVNSTTYAYIPNHGDIVSCEMISDALCVTGSPASSNAIFMHVSANLPAGITIYPDKTDICQGSSVTFTASPVNCGSTPVYQWQVNGCNMGVNSASYCYVPANGDMVSCSMVSGLSCSTGNPATSNLVTLTVNPVLAAGIAITSDHNNICPGTAVAYTATASNGGTTPIYQWKRNGINAGSNSPFFSCIPSNNDIITCQMVSNALCVTGNPALSNPMTMAVTTPLSVSVSINTSQNTICSGNSALFTSAAVNGGSAPIYHWTINGIDSGTNSDTFTYIPSNGDVVNCVLISDIACTIGNPATSNSIGMTVNPILPVSVSIARSSNNVCEGTIVDFTATPVNGGSIPVLSWFVNGTNTGTASATYSYEPDDNDNVSCILTSNLACVSSNQATSNTLMMSVLPISPVSITISPDQNPVCDGTIVNYSAAVTNGGSTPVYQWTINGVNSGISLPAFSFAPSNNDLVTCTLTSSKLCTINSPANSNDVLMTVNQLLPVSISIVADRNNFCQGTDANFTAFPVNAGVNPIFQWKVNGINAGPNQNTFNYTPANNDIITCSLISDEYCTTGNLATSNSISMKVIASHPVSISISADQITVCEGISVKLSAIAVNAGTSPVYQWSVNGTQSGTNSPIFSYNPANGDVVTCMVTANNAVCPTGSPATSNSVVLSVIPVLPVGISITEDSNNLCQGASVSFTAGTTNCGNSPIYQWKVNGTDTGQNTDSFSYIPENGDVISCILTSNASCISGNPALSESITMAVNPILPVSIILSADQNTVCDGGMVNFTTTTLNEGNTPDYQWFVNGNNVGNNTSEYSFIPNNGDQVTCSLVSDALCAVSNPATSNLITITINPILPVGIQITENQNTICQGNSATFTATSTNSGTSPEYQWFVNGSNAGSNSSTFSYIPSDSDIISCNLISNALCPSINPAISNSIRMTVNPLLPVEITITEDQNNVCEGTLVTMSSIIVNGGISPEYEWKVNGVGTGVNAGTFSFFPLNNDVVTCNLISDVDCATGNPVTSNSISFIVNQPIPVSISISSDHNNVCEGTEVTYNAIIINGGTSPVFNWHVNGIPVNNSLQYFTFSPQNGDQVSCHLTSGIQCVSGNPAISNIIFMIVHPVLPVSILITEDKNYVCKGTDVTFASIITNGGTSPVYEWRVNNQAMNYNQPVFSYIPINGDIVSCVLTPDALCPSSNTVASNEIIMHLDTLIIYNTQSNSNGYFCEEDSGTAILLDGSQPGFNYILFRNGTNTGMSLSGTGESLYFGLFSIPGQYSIQGQNTAGNCFAMMRDTINVVMNPTPVTDFTTNNACSNDTTFFTISGNFTQKISTWHWTFGDGTFATYNAPFSPGHVYPTYGIYTVTLSVMDTNGCRYTVTHPVEVLPHPTAFFSIISPNCLNDLTQFTDLSVNPASQGYMNQWIWTFGDGSPADTIDFPDSPNVTHQYPAQGNYNVTLTVNNSKGCSSVYQMVVSLSNRPVADFTSWSSCEDQAAVFQDNSNENLGGQITSWLWNFGEPTSGALNFSTLVDPIHTYATAGLFTVTLIVTNLNGCSDTLQKTITVKTSPVSNFFNSPGCLNSPTQFLADSTIINIQATATYLWNFGDGSTAFSRNTFHIYLAPGTYPVTLAITDTAGCKGIITLPVTINPPPVAHFSSSTDNCQGQDVVFANQSTSSTGFINKWVWDFGDGNTQTILFPSNPDVSHTYAVAGTFSVNLKVTNNEGCTHSENRLVNMLGAPSSDFMMAGYCEGTAVVFTDLTTLSGNQIMSNWNWNFGDPTSGTSNTSTQQNPTHNFATAGTYIVELITFTGNNCSDTITKSITIKQKPAVDFNTQSACADNPAAFTPTGMAVATIASWNWNLGDGGTSTLQAPTHTYFSPGTYSVTLTVTDTAGCSNTRTKPIIIAPIPDANFGYTSPTCQGDVVNYKDLSSTTSGFISKWIWDFGDGNTQTITFPASPDVNHAYTNAGTFNVKLTVKANDSCTNELTRVVTVLPKPTAAFMQGPACLGNQVTFNDLSISNTTGIISGWIWNFGDPTSGTANTSGVQNPTHTYNTAGNYTVNLVVSIPGGCSDTITQQFTVSPPPSVDFTPVAGCNGDTTQFTSTVNLATTQGFYWQFGDGGTAFTANPIHIYAAAGTYTVTLTITDTAGCTNVKMKPVVVIPGPLAIFSSSMPSCSEQPTTFTDMSSANGGSLSNWNWTFGDGSDTTYSSSISSFNHTYAQPGTFQVALHVTTALGCEHTVQNTVTISPSPIAGFDYTNTCQGQSTQFTDMTSLNGGSSLTQRTWDFGDPASGILNTSTLVNPIHNFANPGLYIVTLVTLNAGGCADTLEQTLTISPKPGVDFYNDSLVCFGNMTTLFTDTILTNTNIIQYYEWDFGDGSTHVFTQNASHEYSVSGTFNVTLTVQDTAGCTNTITRPLTIHTAATSMFNYAGICENAPTQFTDLSLPPQGGTIASWYWEFLNGTTILGTDTVQNPEFGFPLPGTYSVKLTTFTENGCNNTKLLPVQIWNKPTAYFKYTASPCANGLVIFQDSSWSYQGQVNNWQWEFEPYQFGTGTNPSHTYYAVDSCYDVKLMIEDLRGCLDTVTQQVCVPSELTADFNTTLTCFGEPVTFTPELLTPEPPADSLVEFTWNFGDPVTGSNNVSTLKTPEHTFSNVGFYTVNFFATDKFGCIASSYKTVQVNALPVANFSYTTGQCDSMLIFSSTSLDTSSTINTWIWQYGDGTSDTLTTPESTHKYASPGEYITTLTVINDNGCTDTFTDTVTRSACIVAAAISTESLLCQNYNLAFADISTCDGTITQWNWNFGDGTPALNYGTYQPTVTHTFLNPGPYTISLKVSTQVGTSTIGDSTTLQILVKPTPLAGFSVDPVCLGVKAEFNNLTISYGASSHYFLWEFDDEGRNDTSSLRNPSYLYSYPGLYNPVLIVKNQYGCADTAITDIMVNGLPDAFYTNSIACMGQKTYFFDASQSYIAPIVSWGWHLTDSVTSIGNMTGDLPSYVFDSTGNYMVMLTVADGNGCSDTIIQQVEVNPSPLSAFSYTENVDNIQGQVQFTNGSVGAEQYFWDFGNGETAYSESPSVTYTEDGTYQIVLISATETGCQDSVIASYEMIFKGLYVPNAFAPGGSIPSTQVWKPKGINLASYKAEIYNRQGTLIWSSTLIDETGSPAESWDGTFKEKKCQLGVYVWKIQAIFRDGTVWYNQDVGEHKGLSEPVYGTITLIR